MARPSPFGRFLDESDPFNISLEAAHPTTGKTIRKDNYDIDVEDPFGTIAAEYAYRMYYFSANRAGNHDLRFVNYTYPVYFVDDATETRTISGGYCNSNSVSKINGTTIPWNPEWQPGDPPESYDSNSDSQVIVIDEATGKCWDLWNVTFPDSSTVKVGGGSIIGSSIDCITGNTQADIYTKNNGWKPSRGIGYPYIAGLVSPEQITAGTITHALSMPIKNPSKAFYISPATKVEHPGSEISNAIPEGMRFYLDRTGTGHDSIADAVNGWLASKTFPSEQYKTLAGIVATALYTYGWFITDTSGSAGWQMESMRSAGTLWTALGIDPGTYNNQNYTNVSIMDGLLVPPTKDAQGNIVDWGNIRVMQSNNNYTDSSEIIFDPNFVTTSVADSLAPTFFVDASYPRGRPSAVVEGLCPPWPSMPFWNDRTTSEMRSDINEGKRYLHLSGGPSGRTYNIKIIGDTPVAGTTYYWKIHILDKNQNDVGTQFSIWTGEEKFYFGTDNPLWSYATDGAGWFEGYLTCDNDTVVPQFELGAGAALNIGYITIRANATTDNIPEQMPGFETSVLVGL